MREKGPKTAGTQTRCLNGILELLDALRDIIDCEIYLLPISVQLVRVYIGTPAFMGHCSSCDAHCYL